MKTPGHDRPQTNGETLLARVVPHVPEGEAVASGTSAGAGFQETGKRQHETRAVVESEQPSRVESFFALAVLLIAGVGIWMLYGPLIRQMLTELVELI